MQPHMPEFAEFYRALNGRDPFPWQARLARQVVKDELWPQEIGVPTGLGKTACLEIAIWWLASQADRTPAERSAPTRIWWVVNRRLLVDSTASQADRIAEALHACDPGNSRNREHGDNVLSAVAYRLRSLSADRDAPPLEVIKLRGGVATRTPTDPSRPTVVLCTLPMYGSRLLFRGYGSRLLAVDAAMAGTDSLVLADEAHLAPHLRSLVLALAECNPGAQPILCDNRSRATVVALTATGDVDQANRFDLADDDERNEVIRMRLDAAKPTCLRDVDSKDVSKDLAEATAELMAQASSPASFLVFANSPSTARATFLRIRDRKTSGEQTPEVILLTGRMREREAERVRTRILDPESGMAAGKANNGRKRHLVVVATQTLEVGADIDAEYLVTETCGVRALTQRLGRLNRLGLHPHSRAIYVHAPPPKRRTTRGKAQGQDAWPVYGAEPAAVLKRLQKFRQEEGGMIDLSPRRVAEALGPPCDNPGRAPEILTGILWEWVKTTTPPEGEAPVEPYFSGIATPEYSLSVIWRAHLPKAGTRLWPRATDREAVEVPLSEFREALVEDEVVHRLSSDGVTVEEVASHSELRPGDQVLIPADRGLMDEFGWNPNATAPVVDVSLLGGGLPLDGTAIKRLCGISVSDLVARAVGGLEDEMDDADRNNAAEKLLKAVRNAQPPSGWDSSEWADFTNSLEPRIIEARLEVPRLKTRNFAREARVGEFDETSLGTTTQLGPHGETVGKRAGVVAERIGVPSELQEVIALAGNLHDIGKADPRFQRWLDPEGNAKVPMAKSNAPRHRWEAMREQAGWPRGGRHEDLSARLVQAWLKDQPSWGSSTLRDLLIHLVISHHGKGRPLVPPVHDDTHGKVCSVVSGTRVEVAADLSVVDWEQPARFRRLNKLFGPWGLALLESIVIRSDHSVSARGDTELVMP